MDEELTTAIISFVTAVLGYFLGKIKKKK